MPWTVIEHFDEETGDDTVHVVPFVTVTNVFNTRQECEAFVADIEAIGNPTVTDDEDNIIGLHIGHTLSPKCVCNPKQRESDPYFYTHNAAN